MAGSIHVDTEALLKEIAKLQEIADDTAVDEALKVVTEAIPEKSNGATREAAEDCVKALSDTRDALANLFSQTIATLTAAEEYFTMTEEELAEYFASAEGR